MIRPVIALIIVVSAGCGQAWDSETHWEERSGGYGLSEVEGHEMDMIDEVILLGDEVWLTPALDAWLEQAHGDLRFDAESCMLSSPSQAEAELPVVIFGDCQGD